MASPPKLTVIDPRKRPWHRQPGESDKSFKAFGYYRDLGVDRTIPLAFNAYTGRDEAPRKNSQIPNYFIAWSRQHNWDERASAYLDHLANLELQKREEVVTSVRSKIWVQRREGLREEKYQLGIMMFGNAREILEYPTKETITQEDGKTFITKPTKWMDKNVAATLAKAGCDLTSDIAGNKQEILTDDSSPDLSRLNEEQLRKLRDILAEASQPRTA